MRTERRMQFTLGGNVLIYGKGVKASSGDDVVIRRRWSDGMKRREEWKAWF